jgi:hypothetical protein
VWQRGAAMTGSLCARLPSGKLTRCYPGTFATDDPPAQILARLLAVLERDRTVSLALVVEYTAAVAVPTLLL